MLQSKFIDVDGIATHYFEAGEGPTVILMHGAALAIDSEFTWFRQIESLSEKYNVIAFDQPGFGLTALPGAGVYMGRERRFTHAMAFLDKLGIESAVLVGHSEGGYIAARMAIVAPHLVSAMIIVASGSTAPMLGGSADDAWIAASKRAYSVGETTEESFIARLQGEAFRWDRRLEEVARRNIRRALADGQVARMRNLPVEETDMRHYMKVQEENVRPHLSRIRTPTLLVGAANDETVPIERGVALMRSRPGSDLCVLDSARHNLMHDRHEAFDSIIANWIASKTSQASRNVQ